RLADEEIVSQAAVQGGPEETAKDAAVQGSPRLQEKADVDRRVVLPQRLGQASYGAVDGGEGSARDTARTRPEVGPTQRVVRRRIARGKGVEAALNPGAVEAATTVGVDGKARAEAVLGNLARPHGRAGRHQGSGQGQRTEKSRSRSHETHLLT